MIRHTVMFKFKADVPQADQDGFVAMLHQLADDISEIRHLEVGRNFTDSARACDILLIVDVDDHDALQTYAQHSEHQPVIQRAGEVCQTSYVVDYELKYP